MISTRVIAAALAVVGVAFLLGPGARDPAATIGAERLICDRAAAAVVALDQLRASVEPGLAAARAASAGVLSGDDAPSQGIEDAAALIADAEEAVAPARRAVSSLASARAAWHPASSQPSQPVAAGELTSIATQLRASAQVADAFADRRVRGTGLPAVLEQALRALDAGGFSEASEHVARARDAHAAIVAWETDLPTLPIWIATMDAMISAVEQIVEATRDGDDAMALEAAEAFGAISDDAATADRALRIALSEGGSALTAAPLERLAATIGAIEDSRTVVAAIVEEVAR